MVRALWPMVMLKLYCLPASIWVMEVGRGTEISSPPARRKEMRVGRDVEEVISSALTGATMAAMV